MGGYEFKERLNKEWSVKERKNVRERKYRCSKNKKKEGKKEKEEKW